MIDLFFVSGLNSGSTLAPLLAAPFVFGDATVTSDNETLTTEHRVHTLLIPFAINGVLQSIGKHSVINFCTTKTAKMFSKQLSPLVPLIFLISFFTCRYQKYDSSRAGDEEEEDCEEFEEEDNDSYDGPRGKVPIPAITTDDDNSEDFSSIRHRPYKLVLAALAASTYITAELGYLSFCAAMYQYLEEVHLSATTSTQVQSVMSVTYTAGRFLTAFISFKLKPDRILAYHYVVLLGSVAVLVFAGDSLLLIYVGNAALGFGFSACWP